MKIDNIDVFCFFCSRVIWAQGDRKT